MLQKWIDFERKNIIIHEINCYLGFGCHSLRHKLSCFRKTRKKQTWKDIVEHNRHPNVNRWTPWKNLLNTLWLRRKILKRLKRRRCWKQSLLSSLWFWPRWFELRTCQPWIKRHRIISQTWWTPTSPWLKGRIKSC